ncbi:cadherin-17 [Hyperolius riggenbachi]|uniref:cadherin-17 n=1 Tax=Hyperolius riggenbachi TaxID=752182 RepID=UPI0035A37D99
MRLRHLLILLCCTLAKMLVEAQDEHKGPIEDKTFYVRESGSPALIYQFEKRDTRSQRFVLDGEKDDSIDISTEDGWLRTTKSLDWSKRREHKLQVKTVDSDGWVVEGPRSVTIIVEDINNNIPKFNQSEYYGQVRENSRPGIAFMSVYATDEDDPSTPNAQMVYKIIQQIPDPLKIMFFQINNISGEISTTINGTLNLKAENNIKYELLVLVSDLAERPFSSNTKVYVTVTDDLWKKPAPVTIEENSVLPHPHTITKVQWNDDSVIYELHQRDKFLRFPFTIDQTGVINVTEPLDREEQEQYIFYAVVKNHHGVAVARALEIEVNVADVNDNPPVCPAVETKFEVQENEDVGSTIGVLAATDADQENTKNSRITYTLVEQLPKVPRHDMFIVNEYSGNFQLKNSGLNIQDNSQYRLKVNVSDEGQPRLSTICWVVVNVIDINDHIPIFYRLDYGNVTVREDAPIGQMLQRIWAKDDDQPQTGSSAITYYITEGDPDRMFTIYTNPATNVGNVTIAKQLDYESHPVLQLVIKARNPEPLVTGIAYNESSTTHLTIYVSDVDESPVFSSAIYQASVLENAAIGTKLITINASDPEGDDLKFSLRENTRNWLRIDENTGDIYSNKKMDRETQSHYPVIVVAAEKNNPQMSSSVYFHLYLDDVNDNAPRLLKDYYGDFAYCYPLTKAESFVFEGTDDDYAPFGLSLKFDLANQSMSSDWDIQYVNRTAARLTMMHTRFQKGVINVPILLKDNGRPPMQDTVIVPVIICTCTSNNQCEKHPEPNGGPSVGLALGILFGVLGVIGIILAAVFISMHYKEKKNKENSANAPERERMNDAAASA